MAIRLIKALVLAAVIALVPVTQVTAKHDTVPYTIDHDVATWLTKHNAKIVPMNRAVREGCEIVLTWAVKAGETVGETPDGSRRLGSPRITEYYGYMMIVAGDNARLLAIEMWERSTKQRVLNWIDRDDYKSQVECHTGES